MKRNPGLGKKKGSSLIYWVEPGLLEACLPCGGAKAVFLKRSWVDYSSNRVDKVDYPRVEYYGLTVMDE